MAKKFKITQNPTFKAKVDIPRVGGESIQVEFEFKFLPRKKLAEMYEKWQGRLTDLTITEDTTLTELTDLEIDLQTEQIKDVVVGWDFEDEFNDENIEALVATSVHAARAVIERYQDVYRETKLGN